MAISRIISSERQANDARATIARLDEVLSSESLLSSIVAGLPEVAISGINRALVTERSDILQALEAYDSAKNGDISPFKVRAGDDPGIALIVARISRGLSQKELGRKLGLREQQIQRYESERYRSLSLANYQKFASVLGVRLVPEHEDEAKSGWSLAKDISANEAKKILKHAKQYGWLNKESQNDDDALGELKKNVADHIVKYGAPSLLRTGLNVVDLEDDWALLSWKAQVTRKAEYIIGNHKLVYEPLDALWLLDLVKLSSQSEGPALACDFLLKHGIVVIVERQIPGMKLDGAAFLINDIPVIGLTLLRDAIDNFWFTLMHEVAHVRLHYRTGLSLGFYDDIHNQIVDGMEQEANEFAGNLLIPEEKWKRSPARISSDPKTIELFAKQLGIHPAIVFGRIRLERGNFSIFANKIGQGEVRRLFNKELEAIA